MNPLTLFSILCLVAFAAILLFTAVRMTRTDRASRLHFCNIAEGTHGNGIFSKRTDEAIPRYRLVKFGSNADHVVFADAGEQALFLATDDATAAEDLIAVQALALAEGTVKLITNGAGALAAGDILVAANDGKVAKKSASAGNYYVVGVCCQVVAATDGLELEAIPVGSVWTNA
jgi:hypothetical protein